MPTLFQLPADSQEDLAQFQREIQRFQSGASSAAEFRAFRVPRGVYEQRESDTYMLRVRFPAGVVLPEHLRTLACVSKTYGNGVLHATTRQDIQIHRVLLGNIYPALTELHTAGLSTKGGGGNTVRNIVGCADAGVCANEVFDISPYVLTLTEFLLPDPLSYQLPRKYKIAFSGCSRDCAGATVNDLGFIAKRVNGDTGFAVYVGGGMGASSRAADRLEGFVPAGEVHLVAEAIKRVFDQHGNRRNRQKARIRFLVEEIGLERFRTLYQRELTALRKTSPASLPLRKLPEHQQTIDASSSRQSPGFPQWRQRAAVPQRQGAFYLVQIPLPLGDIDAERLEKLADVVARHGEGAVRATQRQNLILRWVHRNELSALHAELRALRLADGQPPVLRDLVSCAGAATCRLGICLSRGLARAIHETLSQSDLDLAGLGERKINISGCPNSCGRHPVAEIGLFGAARRVQGRLVPHYVLQLGGRLAEGETRLARGNESVPAKNVPRLLLELLQAFRQSPKHPDWEAFLETEGESLYKALVEKYRAVPDFHDNKDYYVDWDATELFSLAGRGPGECGAGVFDLIEVDLTSARETLAQGRRFEATVLAARALLVTRGQQAHDAATALDLFRQSFVAEKLVDSSLAALVTAARLAADGTQPENAFRGQAAEVSRFVEAVQGLYDSMDASLRFKPLGQEPASTTAAAPTPPLVADREVDFRGVVCPLNYVKTKLVLNQLPSGAVLSILLDEPGARSVPESVAKDGHDVQSVIQEGSDWRVVIRKA
ncbi:MAG: sulfurtransferase TusA family protein [Thermoguttaceae bacterium]